MSSPAQARRFRRTRIAAVILLALAAVAVGVLQLPPVATWLARRLVALVPLNPGYHLRVGRVSGNWFGGLAAEEVALVREGKELARVDRLRARYTIGELRGSPLRVREIDVEGVTATARREGDTWDLAKALRKSSDTTAGKGIRIDVVDVRDVSVVAVLSRDSLLRVRGLTARVRDLDMGEPLTARIDRANLAFSPPSGPWFAFSTRGDVSRDFYRFDPIRIQTERSTIAGRMTIPRRLDDSRLLKRLDLRFRGAPVALADLSSMLPSLTRDGEIALDASASAKGNVVTGKIDASIGGGRFTLDASTPIERGKPEDLRLHAKLRGLDPSKVSASAPAGRIQGTLDAVLRGALDTTTGTVDLRLTSSQIGTTKLTSFDLHSDVERGRATLKARGVTPAASVSADGWVTPFDSIPAYRAYGSATSIAGSAPAVRALTGAEADSVLEVSFDLGGHGLSISAAKVTGRLTFDALRGSGERLPLGHTTISLANSRLIARPDLAVGGGQVTAVADVHLGDTLTYRIDRGVITAVNLGRLLGDTLAGPVGGQFSLSGFGSAPATAQVVGQLILGPVRYGERRLDSASVQATLRRGEANAGLRLALGRSRVTADVLVHPFDSTAAMVVRNGRVEALDVGDLLGNSAVGSDLNATFAASHAGRGDSSTSRLDLALLPSTVNRASLESGELGLQLDGREVSGRLGLDGPDGKVAIGVNGTVARTNTSLHTEGNLQIEHLARWTGRKDAEGRLETEFALDAVTDSGGLRTIRGSVGAVGGVGGLRLEEARLVLVPVQGAIGVDTIEIRSNVAHLAGRGTVAMRKESTPGVLRILGRLGDLAPLAALTGDTVSMDSGSVALELAGPASRWRYGGRLDAHGLLFADNLAERMTLEASGTIDSTRDVGVRGELRVVDAALGKISVPNLRAVARYDSLVALDADMQVGDSLRLTTTVRGMVAGDTVRTALQKLDLTEGGRHWALDRPAKLELGRRVRLDSLSLSAGDRHITASGVFDRRDSSDVRIGIVGFDLGGLRSAGLSPVGGQLDGELHLVGPASAPTLTGKIGLAILDSSGKVAGRVRTDLEWKGTGLFLDAEAAPAAGGRVTVAGMLPYRFTLAPPDTAARVGVERGSVDTLGISIKADSFNLALFQPLLPPDAARDLAGVLVARGHIGGRLDAPRATGTVALKGAGLTLPALGVSYREGELSGRVEGEDLRIERLRLTTGKKEELIARGIVHLRPLTDPGVELTADLHDFRISDSPTLRTIASGRLQLTGSVNKPSVTGGLNLGPTDVFVGAEAAAAKVKPVELSTEDLRKLARDFGPAVLAKTEEGPSLMSRVSMDIELRLPRRVWIRRRKSPEADIELAGQMRLKQEPGGEMQFVGKVSPVPGRGTLDLSGRTFRLTRGEINLNGPVDSTNLDVTAEYQVPTQGGGQDEGVLISVVAKGQLDSLGLEFSSEPSMSQEDVLSYIVTGHPASDNALLEGGAGQGTSGKQIAFGQLSQAIAGSAGRGLGFDVFQIKQEGTRGLNLTAGRYLSDRFFLNLKLPLGGGSASADPGANLGPGFELEYSARRWLRAGLRGGSLPPGFSLRGRYAY
ncbi:MAG TPA: translocation/assembly module TamB domain-containing protein [Gemmatimonadales bacterium]